MNKSLKATLTAYTVLALITSCANNIPDNVNLTTNNSINSVNLSSKYAVTGKAEFPLTHPLTPSLGLTSKGRGTNNSPFEGGLRGMSPQVPSFRHEMEKGGDLGVGYRTKATLGQVGANATISLIYPPDYINNPNETIATGLTDTSGNFTVNPTVSFNPTDNQVYVLEAQKRIGAAGTYVITIRTYIRWDATNSIWKSMTYSTTSGQENFIYINSKTTALAIIDSYDSNLASSQTIHSIDVTTGVGIPDNTIGGSIITRKNVNDVTALIDNLLIQEIDPVKNISFANNKYFINIEENYALNAVNAGLNCPNCDFKKVDLSNKNITNRDLSFANFTGANITNTDFTGTNLSGATWTDGISYCYTGSVGTCLLALNAPGEFKVNTYTTYEQNAPVTAMDSNGNFVVVWQSGASGFQQIGQDGYGSGIYAQRYSSLGYPLNSEFKVNTYTKYDQRNPSIAMDNDGDFVVSWASSRQENGQTSDSGIYAQRYNNIGLPQGSEFHVNTYTTGNQYSNSLAMDNNGNFVITWLNQGISHYGIYAQRYNSIGIPQGSEFRINTYTTNVSYSPSIAMDNSGNFVIVWQSMNNSCSPYTENFCSYSEIGGQRFNSQGEKVGSEFIIYSYSNINTYITAPNIVSDKEGNFVIVWNSFDAGNFDISVQRYSSSGLPIGSRFIANTYTSDSQFGGNIAMAGNGDFIIGWQSYNQTSENKHGIFAQRYSSTGTIIGSEFKVNTYTTGEQVYPSVAMDKDGDFIVTWQSGVWISNPGIGQDGSGYGIYAKRYNSAGVEQ